MVDSKFKVFGGRVAPILALVLLPVLWIQVLFLLYYVTFDDVIALAIATPLVLIISYVTFILYSYLEKRPLVLFIHKDGLDYHNALLPFVKGQLALGNIDYVVTQEEKSKSGTYSATVLVENGKKRIIISSFVYSNYEELVSSLPWPNKGIYRPSVWDELKPNTVNEEKIYPFS